MRTEELDTERVAVETVAPNSPDSLAPARPGLASTLLRSPATAAATALLIRLAFLYLAHGVADRFYSVGQESGNIAWALASGHGFSAPLACMPGPTAWVAPVYPALLAFGFGLLQMNPYHVIIFGQVLNAIFFALTCWPIYLIAKRLFGPTVGVASSWTWAVLPTAILFPLEWIWDQSLSALLLTALICATLYLCDEPRGEVLDRRRALAWAGYGLGWAFALLTNPAIGLLIPFFAAWIAWQRHKSGARWIVPVAIALFACVLGIVPWAARNYSAFRRFIPVKSSFGLEFWLGNNPDVKIIWSWWRSPASDAAEMNSLTRIGEIACMREKQGEALSFIRANPGVFLDSCFDRFVDTWTALWDQHAEPWVNALHAGTAHVVFCSIFSLIAFAGLMIARRADARGSFPLSAAILLFPVTYYITQSAVRCRHPIEPVMTILAVYAVTCAYAKFHKNVAIPGEATNPSYSDRGASGR